MSEPESMTLDEAVELAKRIQSDSVGMTVRAVGRFLPEMELRTKPERWGVSVLLANGKSMVLWSTLALSMIAPPPAKSEHRKPKPPKRATIDERQEVMF